MSMSYYVIKLGDGYLAERTYQGLICTQRIADAKQYRVGYARTLRIAKRYKARSIIEVTPYVNGENAIITEFAI